MSTRPVLTQVPGVGAPSWGATNVRSPAEGANDLDPRQGLSADDLYEANKNEFPIVARQSSGRDNLGLVAGAAIALVLGLATFLGLSSTRSDTPSTPIAEEASPQIAGAVGEITPVAEQHAGEMTMSGPQEQAGMQSDHMPVAAEHGAVAAPMAIGPAPILVFDGGGNVQPAGASPEARSAQGAPKMLSETVSPSGLSVSDSTAARSSRIAEPANTIVQGTLIPAVLETAINSNLPGFVRAVVSEDVRSFDGSRILVPRSSRLIGEYKTTQQAGQRRVYLLWTRLIRPDGVTIALSSPAVDALGQAGLGGQVNSHFLDRLGSALLTSVVGGASAIASGGATVVVTGGQAAASLSDQQGAHRTPTIRVRQGEPIRVFTARDLVFATAGED